MMRCSIALFIILLASGCTVGPDYKPPIVPVPKQWGEAAKDIHKPVLSKDEGCLTKRRDYHYQRARINGGKLSMIQYSTGLSMMPSLPIWI